MSKEPISDDILSKINGGHINYYPNGDGTYRVVADNASGTYTTSIANIIQIENYRSKNHLDTNAGEAASLEWALSQHLIW